MPKHCGSNPARARKNHQLYSSPQQKPQAESRDSRKRARSQTPICGLQSKNSIERRSAGNLVNKAMGPENIKQRGHHHSQSRQKTPPTEMQPTQRHHMRTKVRVLRRMVGETICSVQGLESNRYGRVAIARRNGNAPGRRHSPGTTCRPTIISGANQTRRNARAIRPCARRRERRLITKHRDRARRMCRKQN